ncbi:MAG: hypothetical protein IJ050_06675 [Clostridia bacterium]|nr:hypothetical protein [Clostridia bacterium]
MKTSKKLLSFILSVFLLLSSAAVGGVVAFAEDGTPVVYSVTFTADDFSQTVEYEYGAESIEEPAVPSKDYYNGAWEAYQLNSAENIIVNAVYTAITYNAVFVADGVTVEEVPYTVETENITAPAVPEKQGYTGVWAEYTLTPGGITVNAVYTQVTQPQLQPAVEIKNFEKQSETGYKENKTFEASASDLPDGAEIHWFVNGKDVGKGQSFTVEAPEEDYTVQAKVIDGEGNVIAESDTASVKVKNGFFDRLKAFFASIIEKIFGSAFSEFFGSVC